MNLVANIVVILDNFGYRFNGCILNSCYQSLMFPLHCWILQVHVQSMLSHQNNPLNQSNLLFPDHRVKHKLLFHVSDFFSCVLYFGNQIFIQMDFEQEFFDLISGLLFLRIRITQMVGTGERMTHLVLNTEIVPLPSIPFDFDQHVDLEFDDSPTDLGSVVPVCLCLIHSHPQRLCHAP